MEAGCNWIDSRQLHRDEEDGAGALNLVLGVRGCRCPNTSSLRDSAWGGDGWSSAADRENHLRRKYQGERLTPPPPASPYTETRRMVLVR